MIDLIEQHRPQIEALCRRFGVKRLELFGSAASGKFDPTTSDVDFFVEFDRRTDLRPARQYFGFLHALEDLLGRHVDLIQPRLVTNPYFAETANRYKTELYAA